MTNTNAGANGRELIVPNPKLKLMDQVREVLRLKQYSIRTGRSYCDWIRRYIRFHRMRHREELFPGAGKVETFLSELAVNGQVAASTQNQAFNALLFLYGQVLHQPLENIQAVRADRPARVPTVLTPEEVKRVIEAMTGPPQLVVKLLYGSGLRLMEALRLRVKDLDFEMKQLTVRDGKGANYAKMVVMKRKLAGAPETKAVPRFELSIITGDRGIGDPLRSAGSGTALLEADPIWRSPAFSL